jgi:hypothetical protein
MCKKNKPQEEFVFIKIPRKQVIPEEFKKAANNDQGTEYFQEFNFGTLITYGHPLVAYQEVLRVLNECQTVDQQAYECIHKGDPYYWLGTAAFLAMDFETAVFFMDAAVSEDLRQNLTKLDTPAHLFIQLRGGHPAQVAKNLVENAESHMEQLINIYNSYPSSNLSLPKFSLDDLRSFFFSKSLKSGNKQWRSLATALISYVLEYDLRVKQRDLIITPSSNEAFLLHLFKGCVLLESLLKLNPKNRPSAKTLGQVLEHVQSDLGLSSTPPIRADEFQDVIDQVRSSPRTIDAAFEIAGKTRNTVGHSLGWEINLSRGEYSSLFENIGIACLHSISALYR